jgi:hypothetical protein
LNFNEAEKRRLRCGAEKKAKDKIHEKRRDRNEIEIFIARVEHISFISSRGAAGSIKKSENRTRLSSVFYSTSTFCRTQEQAALDCSFSEVTHVTPLNSIVA